MKIFKFLFVVSISLSIGNIQADDFECQPVKGDIQLIPAPIGKCPILRKKARRFPDQTFLYELGVQDPPSCFVGRIEGYLGNTPISGKVISGLTTNDLNGAFLTAASAIKIYDAERGRKLGKVFTQDSIFDPNGDTREYLAMIEGTRRFRGGNGHFEILGNVFFPGGAEFTGTLCP